MDEKTEQLRDLFTSITDEETVTESQAETPGSLTATDEERVAAQLREAVDSLRERESFDTDLATDTYAEIVRAFYDGADDAAIADRLALDAETVFAARLDLHLLREGDTDAPFDLAVLRKRRDADAETLAGDLGVDPETVRHYRRVVAAEDAARAANFRFRSAYEDALDDAGIGTTLTDAVTDDGLREATEDIDSLDSDADVSF